MLITSWVKLQSPSKEKLIGRQSSQRRNYPRTSLKKSLQRERKRSKRLQRQRLKNLPPRQRERAIVFSFMVMDSRDVETLSQLSSFGKTESQELQNVSTRI